MNALRTNNQLSKKRRFTFFEFKKHFFPNVDFEIEKTDPNFIRESVLDMLERSKNSNKHENEEEDIVSEIV